MSKSFKVGLEISWFSPISFKNVSIWVPYEVVQSFLHQDDALTLQSPAIKRKLELQEVISDRSCSNLSEK